MAWKLYAQNSKYKKAVQFYDNKMRLKKEICHNITEKSIIQDDIIEYEKETAEFSARIIGIIGEIKDGIK